MWLVSRVTYLWRKKGKCQSRAELSNDITLQAYTLLFGIRYYPSSLYSFCLGYEITGWATGAKPLKFEPSLSHIAESCKNLCYSFLLHFSLILLPLEEGITVKALPGGCVERV